MTPTVTGETAASRWDLLDSRRQEVLNRAEAAAKLTLPALFVKDGHTENTKLSTPYQGLGARAVNTLSSKILLALFPPNSRFFKLGVEPRLRERIRSMKKLAQVEETLAEVETIVVSALERTKLRAVLSQIIKSLLVTGNGLLSVSPELGFRFFNLRAFVVNRDPEGNVLEVITREEVAPEVLPDEIKKACQVETPEKGHEKSVKVFTRMVREGNKFRIYQEINGIEVPGKTHTVPVDSPSLIVLRWSSVYGEDYGRGMVDEYLGDFDALDKLSRDLLKASANAAKIVWLLDPNSVLTPQKFASARSGDVLKGKKDDLSTVGLEKFADFRITLERIRDLKEELSAAFLMNQSVQRDAERVTAEEIRMMAQELEDALGGVYSVLAQELQGPLLRRVMTVLSKSGQIPQLDPNDLEVTITTGLEALGRGHEIQKLRLYINHARELLGEELVATYLKPTPILKQLGAGLGQDTTEILATEDEVEATMQRRQMQQLAERVGPGVAQEITKGAMNNG